MQQLNIILALDSAEMGGIETHVLTLARQLRSRGHYVKVCFFRRYPNNPLYQRLTDAEIAFTFTDSIKGFWRFLQSQPIGTQLHTHGYKAGIVGRLCAKWLNINAISTFHSGDLGQGKLRLYSLLDLYTARFAKAIAVSTQINQRLNRRAALIPNFVSLPETMVQNQANNGRRNVAFVGRLSEEKGPDLFCRLAQSCLESDADLNFVMYGDGSMATELRVEYGDCVDFKGAVVMEQHWQNVDVLCITSRAEGLPLVALEAMSRGIAVIAFNIGGLAQLIAKPDLGWLIPAGDLSAFKQALLIWHRLDSETRGKLQNAVYRHIQNGYSAQSLVPRIEALYG